MSIKFQTKQSKSDKQLLHKQLLRDCAEGDLQGVKELLDKGADINAKDKYGDTALMYSIWNGHINIANFLIDKGSDVNAKDIDGNTPLIDASRRGYTEIVKLLLDRGADINIKNKYGNVPLMCAIWHEHPEIVKLLLDNSADIEVRNNEGRTAISYAFDIEDKDKRQEILEMFNNHCPVAFMAEYMDRSVGVGR